MQSMPRPFVRGVEASWMDHGSEAWDVVESSWQAMARLVIPAGILRIPVFSIPVHFFSQESRFLFRRNFFGTL
jgi:hypothetical protein